jgi:hypothetical protein
MATVQPTVIATLATGGALADLRNLLFSLALFNPKPPKVYLYCDEAVVDALPGLGYKGEIVTNTAAMARYSGLNRQQMEKMPGQRFPSLWFDFMAEKISLLKWALLEEGQACPGVLFCDADICFFGPLPQIPVLAHVGLSPHGIRAADEARYGRYNGGFVWLTHSRYADAWDAACLAGQRFYEQSALEDVVAAVAAATPATGQGALYVFPRTQNFGWWRMWQGERPPAALQAEWSMNRRKQPESAGILVEGEPLGSVHTHFEEQRDAATVAFNNWVLGWLKRLEGGHAPARRLLGALASR